MSFDSLLETCIGLALMYVLLSLLATTINEHIATLFGLRAATLQSGLRSLFGGSAALEPLLDHSLLARLKAPASPLAAGAEAAPAYLSGENFARALIDTLGSQTPIGQGATFQAITKTINDLPDDDKMKGTLRSLVTSAGDDLTTLRDHTAQWFDGEMSHLQGFYKQKMHLISALVGLAMAVALNADSLAVAQTLWRNPVLRLQLAQAGAMIDQQAHSTITTGTGNAAAAQPSLDAQTISTQLQAFPIGWDDQTLSTWTSGWTQWAGWRARLLALAGWLVTMIAISLGAPFWFDMLGNLVNLRGAARPPATSATTAS